MYLRANTLRFSEVKKTCFAIIAVFVNFFSFSQKNNTDSTIIHEVWSGVPGIELNQSKTRFWLITGVNIAGYGSSLVIFNNTWYKDFPKSPFHTFNDSKEWLQVDKIGHGWAAYNTGRLSTAMWRWAGLPPKKSSFDRRFKRSNLSDSNRVPRWAFCRMGLELERHGGKSFWFGSFYITGIRMETTTHTI